MPINMLSAGVAVAPTVIQTYINHYLNRSNSDQKPTAEISYHEGVELVRRFLHYASLRPVEDLQAFTAQTIPIPHWVHGYRVGIPDAQLRRSAQYINAQLGPKGIEAVGGRTWWQWRTEGTKPEAEWIEMKKDRDAREKSGTPKGQRIMLYVHGGAYFMGSVDEHRYQMQRHARKLQARVFAPRYRLAPQFPFPCGLHDCLAAYLYLLEEGHDPNTIVLGGDSAGGGMVLSMLVVMRDQGIPLPAGAILISPWVDLTHSFPSVTRTDKLDYIPGHGFLHKPSISWPPPNADDLIELQNCTPNANQIARSSPRSSFSSEDEKDYATEKGGEAERVRGYSVNIEKPDLNAIHNSAQAPDTWCSSDGKYSISPNGTMSMQLEDKMRVQIKDQIHLYAPNHLLTHPLVSPALQPSLGGLPPLLIQCGGGELLRDEQIYVAHKAANPAAYLPPPSNTQTAQEIEAQASKYKPTNVQLQVWDDLCHVAPALSFTQPAKYMYRSIAQFGAWALARAQKTSIDILDDDNISIVSSGSDNGNANNWQQEARVGKAGDSLPPFENHMVRQRVDLEGYIYPLVPEEKLDALQLPRSEVGVFKTGPVNTWMRISRQRNTKFAKQKIMIQQQRIREMKAGFVRFAGENPPPTALAGRRAKGVRKQKAARTCLGMSLWSLWGSKHDEATINREQRANQMPSLPSKAEVVHREQRADSLDRTAESTERSRDVGPVPARTSHMNSRPRYSTVIDRGQTNTSEDDLRNLSRMSRPVQTSGIIVSDELSSPPTIVPKTDGTSTRPSKGGIAYPFSLKIDGQGHRANASTITLHDVAVMTPAAEEAERYTLNRLGAEKSGIADEKFSAGADKKRLTSYF